MALEQNRCGAQICFIHTIKYEFVAILKDQDTSHINLYCWLPLKKTRGPQGNNGLKLSQSFRQDSFRFTRVGSPVGQSPEPATVYFEPNSLIFAACPSTVGIKLLQLYSEKMVCTKSSKIWVLVLALVQTQICLELCT